MGGPLLILIVVQLLIALVVVVFLKKFLDRELKEAALEKFERVTDEQASEIVVRSCSALEESFKSRVLSISNRKFNKIPVRLEEDVDLKGGVVIAVGSQELNYSIKERLRNFWS